MSELSNGAFNSYLREKKQEEDIANSGNGGSGETPTLDEVLAEGNTSSTGIAIDNGSGTKTEMMSASFRIYNNGFRTNLVAAPLTDFRSIDFPDADMNFAQAYSGDVVVAGAGTLTIANGIITGFTPE